MDRCHICKIELNQDNIWVDGLCEDCVKKINSNAYNVIVCSYHQLPQELFKKGDNKPYPQYYFSSRCNFDNYEELP